MKETRLLRHACALAAALTLTALVGCASTPLYDGPSATVVPAADPAPTAVAARPVETPVVVPETATPMAIVAENNLPTGVAAREGGQSQAAPAPVPSSPPSATSIPAPVPARPVAPTPNPDIAQAAAPTATTTPPTSPALRGPQATTNLVRTAAAEMQLGDAQGVARSGDSIQLGRQPDGAYVPEGSMLSEQYASDHPFNDVVLSWNADAPAGTRLEFQVRVGDGSSPSPWFTLGTWGPSGGSSLGRQGNSWGAVDVDTLELSRMANWFQYRVLFSSGDRTATPSLKSISVAYSDMSKPLGGPKPALMDGWARDLIVPQHSQLEEDATVARAICSPTSVAMVLGYWGKNLSVKQVYQGVRDARSGIFGNWPLNTAYAGALGFDAWVDRFHSVEQIQNEIAQGRPVIVSVRFSPGQLDNSPIASTTGHLIVVRGFTPQGDFIVNDPIAPSSSTVRRIYKRDQFGNIWQASGGIVYLIRPR